MGVMKLEKYQFSQGHNQVIVRAIVEGYRKYIDHRIDRKGKMTISSAFAWTKDNFIESEIAETGKEHGFTFERSKAGPTWNYLQFINDETKSLFLMKNADYFNPEFFARSKTPIPGQSTGNSRTYMQELAKINQRIEFSEDNKPGVSKYSNQSKLPLSYVPESQISEQLALFNSKYDSFHILTYKLDQAQQINEVMHYLPNPADNIAYLIEDLSHYISGAELTDQDRSIVSPEHDEAYFDPEIFDLGILEEEKENN